MSSRQLEWQKAHQKRGLCRNCSEPVAPGTGFCWAHLLRNRRRYKKIGSRRGRPTTEMVLAREK